MKIFNQIEWDRIEVSRKGAKLGKVTNSFVNFAPLREKNLKHRLRIGVTMAKAIDKAKKKRILNAAQVKTTFERFAREMAKQYGNLDQVVFIGIRTRGPYIAKRLAEIIRKRHKKEIPIGEMDITLYRDDLNALLPGGTIDHTRIPFDIGNKIVVLFDDVLHTGRTVRAAVDHLIDLGRPRMIHLAVMIDRGGRELPIAANYVGKKIYLKSDGNVEVRLKEVDKADAVLLE